MSRQTHKHFTAREDAVLWRHFPPGGAAACAPHLPGRTLHAIKTRAYSIGLTRGQAKTRNGKILALARRRPRARVTELVRQTPEGGTGKNWWRATIVPAYGAPVVHYTRGTRPVARRKAKDIAENLEALQSPKGWHRLSINGSAEIFNDDIS